MKKFLTLFCLSILLLTNIPILVSDGGARNVIYVDDDGGADYTSIQDAIDIANPGDTIFVYNGTYNERINVNKDGLLIKGENNNSSIIKNNWIVIRSDNVILENFWVKNSSKNGIEITKSFHNNLRNILITNSSDHGIVVTSRRDEAHFNTIENCKIYANGGTGIKIYPTWNSISDNRGHCNFNQIKYCSIFDNEIGVQIGIDDPGQAIYNSITQCKIYNNSADGIKILHPSTNTLIKDSNVFNNADGLYINFGHAIISNTSISNNSANGINLYNAKKHIDINNITVFNNKKVGLLLNNAGHMKIYNSSIESNSDGLYITSTENGIIYNSTINNNSNIGIKIKNSYNNRVFNSSINSNSQGFRLIEGSEGNIIDNCFIKKNLDYGVYSEFCEDNIIYNNFFSNPINAYEFNTPHFNQWNITKINATNIIGGTVIGGNYWSDYSGIDEDGDGIGDTPYDIPDGDNLDRWPLIGSNSCSNYDVNQDGTINFQDAGLTWVHRTTQVPYDPLYDMNNDGTVNFQDAGIVWIHRD